MEGDEKGGFTIFYADEGLDTGPMVLQKVVDIDPNETVDTIYNRFLYPEGIKGMVCIYKINDNYKGSRYLEVLQNLCLSLYFFVFYYDKYSKYEVLDVSSSSVETIERYQKNKGTPYDKCTKLC